MDKNYDDRIETQIKTTPNSNSRVWKNEQSDFDAKRVWELKNKSEKVMKLTMVGGKLSNLERNLSRNEKR